MVQPIIESHIWQVGGPDISHPYDCAVYLVDFGEPLLVDAGFGAGFKHIVANVQAAGVDPASITRVILTHCHIDHMGGARLWRNQFGSTLIMHELDAEIVGRGDNLLTAAFCFEVVFEPLTIDLRLKGGEGTVSAGTADIAWLHTPGHTPGSISLYLDMGGKRVLFAQDIQAPLLKEFECNRQEWQQSIESLMALDADVLCDGHSGAWQPARRVRAYLEYAARTHRE